MIERPKLIKDVANVDMTFAGHQGAMKGNCNKDGHSEVITRDNSLKCFISFKFYYSLLFVNQLI